jgi:hypothetical protein
VIVRNNTKKTFYTYAGDWLVALGMLIVAGWLLIKLKNLNKKKPKSKKQKTKASKIVKSSILTDKKQEFLCLDTVNGRLLSDQKAQTMLSVARCLQS